MVKAKAPKAPTGAAFIRMATSRNTTCESDSSARVTGRAGSPTSARARPNRIETNSVCRMLPLTKAPTRESGITPSRKPVIVVSCAAWAYWLTAPASSVAGSTFRPRPGRTTLAITSPTIRARVDKVRK